MSTARSVAWGPGSVALGGNGLNVGDKAPNFTLTGNDLKPVTLADFAGKNLVISTIPSLDTGTCDTETRHFNEVAASLGDDVEILTVSMDLPFAQKRWCGAAGVDRVTTLSAHTSEQFGEDYGVIIPPVRLLARCVFVVDKEGTVRYVQVVEQTGSEPDYDPILAAVKELA